METRRCVAKAAGRCVIAGAMSAVLIGCGGGGSGSDDAGFGDSNGDGIEDADLDGDGFVDDVNGDGIEDFDLDGDGFLDVDLNENGIIDSEEDSDGSDGLSCSNPDNDPSSEDDEWNNNCVLRNGVTSYYTRGVQRILYCLGFNDDDTASIGEFADAQFGDITKRAVEAFQAAHNEAQSGIDDPDAMMLVVDGVVGEQTWQALRDSLEFIADNFEEMDESYAIAGARDVAGCGDRVQFYREYDFDDDGFETYSGWKIANNPGEAQRVEFSIRNPFE